MEYCPEQFIRFSHQLADAVGEIHRQNFRRSVSIETKSDGTWVTDVDKQSERVFRDLVAQTYPDHGVIGEEYPPLRPDADYVWIIDPLDGTNLYLVGKPQFAVLIALAYRGKFILGVIDQAILKDRWVGANGHGTIFNGKPVHTRQCESLTDAVLFRPGIDAHTVNFSAGIDSVSQAAQLIQWGITPYDYGLVASGFIDLIVAAGPKLHDLAPLGPIIRNAGGMVTDWTGAPLSINSSGFVIASGDAALIDEVVRHLNKL